MNESEQCHDRLFEGKTPRKFKEEFVKPLESYRESYGKEAGKSYQSIGVENNTYHKKQLQVR